MKVIAGDNGPTGIELTRRNLLTLLVKLDGKPAGSACTIIAPGTSFFYVHAVEDNEHYADRDPGLMHLDTEEEIVGTGF